MTSYHTSRWATEFQNRNLLFLVYGRQPLFPATIQHFDEQVVDEETKVANFESELKNRGAALRHVMPLAMGNMAIAQN